MIKKISKKTFAITDKKINLVDEVINVYLSIDDCSFDRLASKIKKYAFVFYLPPINHVFKSFLIYFHPEKNGKANDLIIKITNDICEVFKKNKHENRHSIRVVSISTDSDNFFNNAFA